jgi:hypothetical protein
LATSSIVTWAAAADATIAAAAAAISDFMGFSSQPYDPKRIPDTLMAAPATRSRARVGKSRRRDIG